MKVLVQNPAYFLNRGRFLQARMETADDKFGLRVIHVRALVRDQAIPTLVMIAVASGPKDWIW